MPSSREGGLSKHWRDQRKKGSLFEVRFSQETLPAISTWNLKISKNDAFQKKYAPFSRADFRMKHIKLGVSEKLFYKPPKTFHPPSPLKKQLQTSNPIQWYVKQPSEHPNAANTSAGTKPNMSGQLLKLRCWRFTPLLGFKGFETPRCKVW